MKKMMCITAIITAFMLLVPLAVLGEGSDSEVAVTQTAAVVKTEKKKTDIFKVYNHETKEITEMSADDYIFCVVAAEMPALYNVEAIKAQAVASYTYACYKREENKSKEYDISTDFNTDQSFKTEEKARADWGENAQEYVNKIKNAIKEVSSEKITYKGETILAVYHAVSSGVTYSAEDVWGKKIDYLKSVDSAGDKTAKKYMQTFEFPESELKEKLGSLISKPKDNTPLLGEVKAKENGLVEYVKVYGNKIKGSDIRTALGLASSNFKFEKNDGKYIFTTLGYGHGVGMSQNGANVLANEGKNYKQILKHYYTGTKISK
ncbi:MAG: stage II sporulation protein D [Clostridia bacterium]|nr:stage II sporulation protein D [Clostridia bacterium]